MYCASCKVSYFSLLKRIFVTTFDTATRIWKYCVSKIHSGEGYFLLSTMSYLMLCNHNPSPNFPHTGNVGCHLDIHLRRIIQIHKYLVTFYNFILKHTEIWIILLRCCQSRGHSETELEQIHRLPNWQNLLRTESFFSSDKFLLLDTVQTGDS